MNSWMTHREWNYNSGTHLSCTVRHLKSCSMFCPCFTGNLHLNISSTKPYSEELRDEIEAFIYGRLGASFTVGLRHNYLLMSSRPPFKNTTGAFPQVYKSSFWERGRLGDSISFKNGCRVGSSSVKYNNVRLFLLLVCHLQHVIFETPAMNCEFSWSWPSHSYDHLKASRVPIGEPLRWRTLNSRTYYTFLFRLIFYFFLFVKWLRRCLGVTNPTKVTFNFITFLH